MKNTLILLTLTVGLWVPAQAQRRTFGIKAGLGLTTWMCNSCFGAALNSVKPGPVLGMVASFPLGQRLRLQPELLYAQKGYQYRYTSFVHLDYLDLPLMLRYSPAASGVFLEAGPQVGWLPWPISFATSGSSLTLRSYDLGYAGGVGYQLRNGWSASLRYNGGLAPLYIEERDFYQNPIPRVRNAALQLAVTHLFARK